MQSITDVDLGTPVAISQRNIAIEIDGIKFHVADGTTVMRATAEAGISIPKLCATDMLEPFGSCRMCLVQIEGMQGYPASCTTNVREGMKIITQNNKLGDLRRQVMELYISDHPLDCLTCPANGHCELQDMAGDVGLREVRYGYDGANHVYEKHESDNNPLFFKKDESNPYFTFDPSKCIVCSRCVRACDEVQGTFALTIQGRGFNSKVSASQDESFLDSECVSCGACVQACPTATLSEKSLIEMGQAEHSVITTCGYCGVGCSFKAEMKGSEVQRMVPNKDGHANHGHSCVKGRFAIAYASHPDRVKKPLIRDSIKDQWREVSWEEAIDYAANEFKRIQKEYGKNSVGGITSSRCSNEETYLVQKLVRAGFGNNNVDTCARVCHSPTGYGLKNTLGESAGTQDFDSVMETDVMIIIGANPTEGHPVFSSQMKRRLREGAKLIIIDPRSIAMVRSPHIEADYHLKLKPGTNVAVLTALANVIVTEGLVKEDYVKERCESDAYLKWKNFVSEERHTPEAMEDVCGVPSEIIRGAARLYASAGNGAIYYGLGVTEHAQGSTAVIGIANLAMATGNLGRKGVGVNPLRGQNNVQGACDMGSFPHEFPGYRHVSDDTVRHNFETLWGRPLISEPGLRIPNMFEAALDGSFKGIYIQGEDFAQSDPDTQHVIASLEAMECVVVQDLFINETAKYAHVFLPGSSFLEKNGTFTNAERRISPVRKVMPPLAGKEDWEITCMLSNALGYPMNYQHPSEVMDEIAKLTPTFTGVSYSKIDQLGSIQWPCNEKTPEGTPVLHVGEFVRGKGKFMLTEYVPSHEKNNSKYPLILTSGRILSQYNVGAQTRRTENVIWNDEDRLEIHPHDAQDRGIETDDWVGINSRSGETVLRAIVTERVQPGVVYTTFHFPETGANVVTSDHSDWATNCPEYKVTAVQAQKVNNPSNWQIRYRKFSKQQKLLYKNRDVVT